MVQYCRLNFLSALCRVSAQRPFTGLTGINVISLLTMLSAALHLSTAFLFLALVFHHEKLQSVTDVGSLSQNTLHRPDLNLPHTIFSPLEI